ncbi:MAG: SMI1/KNR4 family protein [Nitrosomonadales bacterium]|nr:SMI1/KNR4 family protein [Nitrosomonadales bacterium]
MLAQNMDEIAKVILTAKRKRLFMSRPVYKFFAPPITEAELYRLAQELNVRFAVGFSRWLRLAGYGDVDGKLQFRRDFIFVIDWKPLAGCVVFAGDAVGNRYAFDPERGNIYHIRNPGRIVSRMADDFSFFMQELIRRDYQLYEWTESLSAK